MKKYKDLENNIHAFEDDVNEDFLNKKIEELGLIAITDEEENAIREQKDIDDQVVEKRELAKLEAFLNNTNYIAINHGAKISAEKRANYLAEMSDTYGITNEEVLNNREQAINKINELQLTLNN